MAFYLTKLNKLMKRSISLDAGLTNHLSKGLIVYEVFFDFFCLVQKKKGSSIAPLFKC